MRNYSDTYLESSKQQVDHGRRPVRVGTPGRNSNNFEIGRNVYRRRRIAVAAAAILSTAGLLTLRDRAANEGFECVFSDTSHLARVPDGAGLDALAMGLDDTVQEENGLQISNSMCLDEAKDILRGRNPRTDFNNLLVDEPVYVPDYAGVHEKS